MYGNFADFFSVLCWTIFYFIFVISRAFHVVCYQRFVLVVLLLGLVNRHCRCFNLPFVSRYYAFHFARTSILAAFSSFFSCCLSGSFLFSCLVPSFYFVLFFSCPAFGKALAYISVFLSFYSKIHATFMGENKNPTKLLIKWNEWMKQRRSIIWDKVNSLRSRWNAMQLKWLKETAKSFWGQQGSEKKV